VVRSEEYAPTWFFNGLRAPTRFKGPLKRKRSFPALHPPFADLTRDLIDTLAIVAVSAGAVCVFALVCALAMQ
jgi:hypothetical protein